MTAFQETTVDELFSAPNAKDVVQQYANETGNKYLNEFVDPYNGFKSMENLGIFKVASAIDDDGKLCGVVAVVIARPPHLNVLTANVQSIWVREDKRAELGLGAVRIAKKIASDSGCKGLYIGCKSGTRFEELLKRIAEPMTNLYWMSV